MKSEEKIVSRAFECTYFDWFDIDHYHPAYSNEKAYSETIHAETASKARYKFFMGLDWNRNNRKELFTQIKVRRLKHLDLIEDDPHPALTQLTESQLSKMKHAVGMEGDLQHNIKFGFYRNRYVVPNDEDFNQLVAIGLALKSKNDSGLEYYYLTDEGQKVIRSLLPITRQYKYKHEEQTA